jgi:UDP-N-acetylglucosamine 1-carboxyvinyltransferase
MESIQIHGGIPLHGTVATSGAKNASLPIMAAAMLADSPVLLRGVPYLRDVSTLSQVLGQLGVEVTRQADDGLLIETIDPTPVRAPYRLVRRMRASFCVLGPLLAQRGRAEVSLPGGCNLGNRKVDLHLSGLTALGAVLKIRRGYVLATAGRLRGATIHMSGESGPTVTGTANVMSAAVLARGETVIRGAALEPEIVDLGNFLRAMGARIEGLGTSTLRVSGVEQLSGTQYEVIPDRIEAATLLIAGAINAGCVRVTGARVDHLGGVLQVLDDLGATIELLGEDIQITGPARPRAARVTALPYPGLPSDVLPQLTALLTLADGTSDVQDRVFPDRFLHLAEFARLGGSYYRHAAGATIHPVSQLEGASVVATDLRAGAALVLAGLAAQGQTTVNHVEHLDRGYQRLDDKLALLGARIQRVGVEPVQDAATMNLAVR